MNETETSKSGKIIVMTDSDCINSNTVYYRNKPDEL